VGATEMQSLTVKTGSLCGLLEGKIDPTGDSLGHRPARLFPEGTLNVHTHRLSVLPYAERWNAMATDVSE